MSDRIAKSVCVLLTAFIVLSFLPCSIVLCIGEDGRMALEYSNPEGGCGSECDPSHSRDTNAECIVSEDNCCGPCLDILLPSVNLDKSITTSQQSINSDDHNSGISLYRQYSVSIDARFMLAQSEYSPIVVLRSAKPLVLRI